MCNGDCTCKKENNYHMIKLDAGHTQSGNPKRVYVLIGELGNILETWDEGYDGFHAVGEDFVELAKKAPQFKTTTKEYKKLLKYK